jgi:hypothetical protein
MWALWATSSAPRAKRQYIQPPPYASVQAPGSMGLYRLLEAGRATLPFRNALFSRRLDPSTAPNVEFQPRTLSKDTATSNSLRLF